MDARYYRDEAERCLELAARVPYSKSAKRWRRLADRYAVLAEEQAASETGRAPLLRMPRQQQQVQQHQSKTQPK
jgi:hypothetical protein